MSYLFQQQQILSVLFHHQVTDAVLPQPVSAREQTFSLPDGAIPVTRVSDMIRVNLINPPPSCHLVWLWLYNNPLQICQCVSSSFILATAWRANCANIQTIQGAPQQRSLPEGGNAGICTKTLQICKRVSSNPRSLWRVSCLPESKNPPCLIGRRRWHLYKSGALVCTTTLQFYNRTRVRTGYCTNIKSRSLESELSARE